MMRAIGLMSGTSMDGIDVAVLDTDGEDAITFGPTGFRPYAEDERALLREALMVARDVQDRGDRRGALGPAERMITNAHAEAVTAFMARHEIEPSAIALIGFHGQTVLHRPEDRLTIQIGDGAALANRLGVPVIADMRAADVAAGGQGAPLVPAFHRALVRASDLPRPVLVINIGGVANITFVTDDHDPIACDTGPGNALLDDLMLERTGTACDRDGASALAGHVDADALARLLDHSFFDVPPPKSLDRNAFSRTAVDHLSTADAAATLTAFTAASIARCLPLLPARPALAIVCGGGANNPTLMRELAAHLPCPVKSADHVGWLGDAVEAQAFAYLAVRSRRNLPLTYPSTTGVPHATTGGRYFPA